MQLVQVKSSVSLFKVQPEQELKAPPLFRIPVSNVFCPDLHLSFRDVLGPMHHVSIIVRDTGI
jgi:hypothetical protein